MPLKSNATPRTDLTPAFSQFDPAAHGFRAREILYPNPNVDATNLSYRYGVIPMDAWLASQQNVDGVKRASKGDVSRSDWEYREATGDLDEYSHEVSVDEQDYRRYADDIDAEEAAMERARIVVETALEFDVKELLFDQDAFDAVDHFEDVVAWAAGSETANPIRNVATGKKVLMARGLVPDLLVIPYAATFDLAEIGSIVDRIKYISGAVEGISFTEQYLSRIFEIPRVVVVGGHYNAANPGQAAQAAHIWGETYAGLYCTHAGDINQRPHIGRIHQPSDFQGIETYEFARTSKVTDFGATMYAKPERIYTEAGYLMKIKD